VQHVSARFVVCSLAAAAAFAACGGSSSRTSGGAAKPAASAPADTTTTVTRAITKANVTTDGIDLSGTPGVSPAQQHRAEQLIRDTIVALRRYDSPLAAYADGYRSIGDRVNATHYVKWSYTDDGHILDPLRPESIVYQKRGGVLHAVAAMYQLPFGKTFADVPDVGGSLTQWHVHNNLCLTDDPEQKIIARFTAGDGSCPPGTGKASDTPMLHVWIVPTPCGPFAAIEGGSGQVPDGETRRCDTRYASVP
jgi:hypothetical protein